MANTWGYGAQTNSYNDIRNAKTMIIMGGNPAEAHPVSLQHVLTGKELNRANLIVIDPRFTRTAAHATEYVRLRPGTDIPMIWGLLWHIFENGWEDKEFIAQRVYGMEEIRAEVAKWTPEEVRARHRRAGRAAASAWRRSSRRRSRATLIWCMGATQKTVGTANVRAYSILLLATGNVGAAGDGRQHLPRPYQRAGRHRLRPRCHLAARLLRARRGRLAALVPGLGRRLRLDAWARFDSKALMETPGIPTTRWFDATLMPASRRDRAMASQRQPHSLKAHDGLRPWRQHRHPHARKR